MLLARHTWGRAPGGNVEDEEHSKRRPEALMALAAAQNTLPSCPSLNAAPFVCSGRYRESVWWRRYEPLQAPATCRFGRVRVALRVDRKRIQDGEFAGVVTKTISKRAAYCRLSGKRRRVVHDPHPFVGTVGHVHEGLRAIRRKTDIRTRA